MPVVCWTIDANGRYVLDIQLGSRPLSLMIDTGLADRHDRTGFEVDPAEYDGLNRAGELSNPRRRTRFDAGGNKLVTEVAAVAAQLLDPITRQPVGPKVTVEVMRGTPGVPSRVGAVFFHRLTGCRVIWHLDTRTWCVEYP
jgi:hypothetical protein